MQVEAGPGHVQAWQMWEYKWTCERLEGWVLNPKYLDSACCSLLRGPGALYMMEDKVPGMLESC